MWGCTTGGESSAAGGLERVGIERQTAGAQTLDPYVFDANWPAATAEALATAVSVLSDALGAHVDPGVVPASALTYGGVSDRAIQAIPGPHGLVAQYTRGVNDLQLSLPDNAVAAKDDRALRIGPDQARVIAEQGMSILATRGLLARGDFPTVPRTSTVVTRRGHDDVTLSEVADEYHFTYVRTINGIPFPNAGVVVSVTAFGRTRRIRVGGAVVSSLRSSDGREVPAMGTKVAHLDLSEQSARLRFQTEHPNAKISNAALSYTFNASQSEIEPRLLVSFADTFAAGGDIATSRQRTMAYPLRTGGEVVDYSPVTKAPAVGAPK